MTHRSGPGYAGEAAEQDGDPGVHPAVSRLAVAGSGCGLTLCATACGAADGPA